MSGPLPRQSRVGVVGCGTMGMGIAQVALAAGHPVSVYDVSAESARRAVDAMIMATDRRVGQGRLSSEQREDMLARLSVVPELAGLAECALVIEAAAEDLDIKRRIFSALEDACSPEALLLSNTSSISVTAIAAALRRPHRVAGMHFFNPATAMRLVEVVAAVQTDAQVVKQVTATAEAWGKVAVRVSSTPGFVVNRVARPFYGEALRVLAERAADPATIDAVMREAGGFRMGPFELMDLIGLDVNLAVTKSVWTAFDFDPRYTPSLSQKELVASGRLGRKSGQGWYDYGEDATKMEPSTERERPAPSTFHVGDLEHPLADLVARLEQAGMGRSSPADQRRPLHGLGLPQGGELRVTDGRTASAVSAETTRPVVLVDFALDYRTASRLAVTASDGCPEPVLDAAVGLLQRSGLAVSVVDDAPGLIVARTVAMLVNEAADVVSQGIAQADDVDLAMLHGVNHPRGPIAWGRQWGFEHLLTVLDHLSATYGDGHHRASPWLRRQALRSKR